MAQFSKVFFPYDPLPAQDLNDIVGFMNGVADGTNLEPNSVGASNMDYSTFPNMQAWTPSVVGFSSLPAGAEYYYTKFGKQVTIYVSMPANGTSNSTSFTISLPVQAATITNFKWVAPIVQPIDNGVVNTTNSGIATIESAGTVLTFLRNANGNNWTASGGKRVPWFQMSYLCE